MCVPTWTQSGYWCGFDSRESRYRWSVLLLEFQKTFIRFGRVSTCLCVPVFVIGSGYWCAFDSGVSRYWWSVWWLEFEETLMRCLRVSTCLNVSVRMQASSDVDSIVDSLAIDAASCCLRLKSQSLVCGSCWPWHIVMNIFMYVYYINNNIYMYI